MQMPPSFHPYAGRKNECESGEKTLKKIIVPLIAVFLMASLFSCTEKKEANRKTENDVQGKILATVNGVPITEDDVKLKLEKGCPWREGKSRGNAKRTANPCSVTNLSTSNPLSLVSTTIRNTAGNSTRRMRNSGIIKGKRYPLSTESILKTRLW